MMTYSEVLMGLEIGLIYGLVAIGIYLTFRIIDFPDLTCDASFSLGAATSGALLSQGYDPYFSLLAALCMGALAGMSTGWLHTQWKITDVLCGILVGFMLYSVNLRIMGGVPNIALMSVPTLFNTGSPLVLLMGLIGSVLSAFIYLFRTHLGLALRSVGQNKVLAQNSGIILSRMLMMGLALSNACIALAGALLSQHQGFADIGSGTGALIIGLTSVTIGEKFFPSRSLSIQLCNCIVGSIVYRWLIGLALHSSWLGLQTQDLNLLSGILVVVLLAARSNRRC